MHNHEFHVEIYVKERMGKVWNGISRLQTIQRTKHSPKSFCTEFLLTGIASRGGEFAWDIFCNLTCGIYSESTISIGKSSTGGGCSSTMPKLPECRFWYYPLVFWAYLKQLDLISPTGFLLVSQWKRNAATMGWVPKELAVWAWELMRIRCMKPLINDDHVPICELFLASN